MLRRISIDSVEVGMFVHALEGSWFSHSIWRRRFLIADAADLRALRDSGVARVVIDDKKGAMPGNSPALPGATGRGEAEPLPAPDPIAEGPASITAERRRAADIIARSRDTIRMVFGEARLGKAIESAEVAGVVDEIAGSVRRNAHALIGMVRLKAKDEYTYLHSVAVCALMVNFARHLGLPEDLTRDLGMAGLVHDIGKMGVPDDILNKPGQLTDVEFAVVQAHPHHGAEMLGRSDGMPPSALDVCRHHHEKIDGTGYPFGLKGEEISLAARMGAICDVYDALTSNRSYKEAWNPIETVTAMATWEGQFDPDLLFDFFRSIAVFPTGLLVRTQTNHLAVILSNGRRSTRPRLRLFYDLIGNMLIAPRDMVLADAEAADAIVAPADPAALGVHDWQGLRVHLSGELDQVNGIEMERLWHGTRETPGDSGVPGPVERVSAWRPSRRLN